MAITIPDDLVEEGATKIVFFIADGLGGLPDPASGLTELESAHTPNMDRLASRADLGLMDPVDYGVQPGSGPGHLGLFGYDPVRWNIGRGVLSALGVGFPLEHGDVAARLNFASLDEEGRVTDRRAGRPSDDENRRLVELLRQRVAAPTGVEVFFESEKEHRLVLVVRGQGLSAELSDTDPQATGVAPLPVRPLADDAAAARAASILAQVLDAARDALRDEPVANGVLARGFATYEKYPTFAQRYRLRASAIARYPMYRGVARLVGMDIQAPADTDAGSIGVLRQVYDRYDFHFVHFKYTDSRGEDGDFVAKVKAIEALDPLVAEVESLQPDVLVVTGDHSTPSRLRSHSWHPVPLMLVSPWTRPARGQTFGERACSGGSLGRFPARKLMTLALAHALRLQKFGA